jgi:lipoate---protein ligase
MVYRVLDLEGIDIYNLHATEDYLLQQVAHHGHDPIVMFSRLSGPSVSIGIGQNLVKDVNLAAVQDLGAHVTRRKTGGRAVYLDDNHYVVSVIERSGLGSMNVNRAYEHVCGRVIEALHQTTDMYFQIRHVNDIMTLGYRKIGGAAQKNSGEATLVHCYLRYRVDLPTMLQLIMIDGHSLRPYEKGIAKFARSLEQETEITESDFYLTFQERLLSILGESVSVPLTDIERASIDTIVRDEYTHQPYIHGKGTEPSRGHCDIIMGSGSSAILRIPELVNKVSFK